MTGQIQGTTHLCQGQEAVSVGAIAAMRPGDVQTNTYRGHGEALALGMEPETAFAELMGRTTGGSGGVGGSMHLIDFSQGQHRRQRHRRRRAADRGRGGGRPSRCRASPTSRCRSSATARPTSGRSTRRSTWPPSGPPRSCSSSPTTCTASTARCGPRRRSTTWPAGPIRSACPGIIVDGQDIDAVHAATTEAVERARARRGPEPARDEDVPLPRPLPLRPGQVPAGRRARRLEGARPDRAPRRRRSSPTAVIGPNDPVEIRNETQAEIDAAAERAAAAPYPTLEETRPYVYAD